MALKGTVLYVGRRSGWVHFEIKPVTGRRNFVGVEREHPPEEGRAGIASAVHRDVPVEFEEIDNLPKTYQEHLPEKYLRYPNARILRILQK